MTLIEGIGDEVTQFFFALLIIAIVSVGWWTTSTSEQRHVQTVWLLDRRRHRGQRRLTNHTHTVTIAEGTSTVESPPSDAPISASSKPPEAGTSTDEAASGSRETNEDTNPVETSEEDNERNSILATMDADACELRQRRVAFYDRSKPEASTEPLIEEDTTIMEHNLAETEREEPQVSSSPQNEGPSQDPSDLRIRLKYINDDLRLVDGKLQEKLEDFKKRHFQSELTSNKLVRLIFNGQVLQPESKTLQSCGLFDNCVVHCLIHQRRPLPGEEATSDVRTDAGGTQRSVHLNNNNQGRDWDLGNFLFALISFTLLSAWYFRYVYAHLYTVTATGGLIVMTGLFTIILFGFYFPDQEHMVPPVVIPPPRMDNGAQAQS